MADINPFDLLGEAEDPAQLIAAQQAKKAAAQPKAAAAPQAKPQSSAKLPSKPLPPSQAVREARSEATGGRGRGAGRGYGRGRGGGGFNRESANDDNAVRNREFSGAQGTTEEGDERRPFERRGSYGGSRGSFRGGRRGGYSNGDAGDGDRPRRVFERRSGTGRGNEVKREGSGRGNWGTPSDELAQVTEEGIEGEKVLNPEKPSGEEDATGGDKETPVAEAEQKEPEDKEMTLEEYEKVLEEKRKALQALKTEERKVDAKEFASMQPLNKKNNDDIFVKLGSDKDKRKESTEKEEKAKKSVSINEFLKPAEGERYYSPGGRGRGRGRGRGGFGGSSATSSNVETPAIEDPGQFPTLGAK